MSSMVRNALIAALPRFRRSSPPPRWRRTGAPAWSPPSLRARSPTRSAAGSSSQASPRFTFEDYAGFLLSYPGFPDEDKLRGYAEGRLAEEWVAPERVLAYFDRHPPLTNPGRAAQALALMAVRPGEAEAAARAAWRGGEMSQTAAATLLASFWRTLHPRGPRRADGRAAVAARRRSRRRSSSPYVSPARAARVRRAAGDPAGRRRRDLRRRGRQRSRLPLQPQPRAAHRGPRAGSGRAARHPPAARRQAARSGRAGSTSTSTSRASPAPARRSRSRCGRARRSRPRTRSPTAPTRCATTTPR